MTKLCTRTPLAFWQFDLLLCSILIKGEMLESFMFGRSPKQWPLCVYNLTEIGLQNVRTIRHVPRNENIYMNAFLDRTN